MTNKNLLGKRGEEAAAKWLITQGFEIIEKNARLGHQEIDLITRKAGLTIFFEIKTGYYLPGDFPLKKRQQRSLKIARLKYCEKHQISLEKTRFDLIIITPKNSGASLEHLANISA